jgi:hypothetical protein
LQVDSLADAGDLDPEHSAVVAFVNPSQATGKLPPEERRTSLVLGVLAMMAAMLVVFTTPALADNFFSSDFEQEVESGDVDQSFEVTSSGDNSNQTAGIQGVANTGNAQNQEVGIVDSGNGFDGNDFFNDDLDEFWDVFAGDDFCDFFFDDDN